MDTYKYTHIVLTGNDCIIERSFTATMDIICGYASICKVKIYVVSSGRDSVIVHGAIVTPAQMSNHLVYHAIDADLEDTETGAFWNSKLLSGVLTGNIKRFIEMVQSNKLIRWGGDFHTRDVVHFDDGLNVFSPDIWHQLYNSKITPTC